MGLWGRRSKRCRYWTNTSRLRARDRPRFEAAKVRSQAQAATGIQLAEAREHLQADIGSAPFVDAHRGGMVGTGRGVDGMLPNRSPRPE